MNILAAAIPVVTAHPVLTAITAAAGALSFAIGLIAGSTKEQPHHSNAKAASSAPKAEDKAGKKTEVERKKVHSNTTPQPTKIHSETIGTRFFPSENSAFSPCPKLKDLSQGVTETTIKKRFI